VVRELRHEPGLVVGLEPGKADIDTPTPVRTARRAARRHRRSWLSFKGSIYRSERQYVDADTRKAASIKLRREARTLKGGALCSLRRAVTAFNSCDDDGRVTCVLLHCPWLDRSRGLACHQRAQRFTKCLIILVLEEESSL
jgi:hypothetical protein